MRPIQKLFREIQCMDATVRAFDPCHLPQCVRAYIYQSWRMDDRLSYDEQELIETTFAPVCDDLARSFIDDPHPDATKYFLFDDGSLYIKTNAGRELWADARDFVVERILPRMELSRLDADLMREIGMDDQIAEVRDDFFAAFAQVLNRQCGIPYEDAREHWNAWSRQLCDSACESIVLGGGNSGRAEGLRFASQNAVLA